AFAAPATAQAVTLTVATSDGTATDTDTVTINVAVGNQAPTIVVPPAQTTLVDTPLLFYSLVRNMIVIGDSDAANANLQVTLSVTNGILSLNTTTGLDFTAGDGTGDATMTFQGTLQEINNAINGLRFDPTAAFTGTATLTVAINDLGNTGAGGSQTANGT